MEHNNTTSIGLAAEERVASLLQESGYQVIARNWRRAQCEIDIVAMGNDTIYFVEVRYRKSSSTGGGFASVNAKKLRHMKRAASIWIAAHNCKLQCVIMVAAVDYQGIQFRRVV